MEKKKKTFTSIITTTIIILIVTIIITSLDHLFDYRKHKPAGNWYWYGYARWPDFDGGYKLCAFNIRMLQGAVEMYNMDNTSMMTKLDLERLLEGKYIKSIPTSRYYNCKYISKGDLLTEDGEICCKLHGNLSEIDQKYKKEKNEFDKKNTIYNVSIRLIPAILYFLYALISLAI